MNYFTKDHYQTILDYIDKVNQKYHSNAEIVKVGKSLRIKLMERI